MSRGLGCLVWKTDIAEYVYKASNQCGVRRQRSVTGVRKKCSY